MARVQRANVVLQVEDHEIQHYLSMGYNLIDERGGVLKEAVPYSIGVLQAKYLEHIKRIAELENTVAQLTAQLNSAPTEAKKNRRSRSTE